MMKHRILASLLLFLSGSALADDFVGQASVVDGDTLEIHGIRIRLRGIDAPESSQLCRGDDSLQYRCGAQAANDLDAFITRRPVNCSPLSLDPYGRTVATCSVAGTDLGEWLVRKGLALDWLNTRKADMVVLSATRNVRASESGKAATSSRGSIAPASVRMESRLPVRMTPTRIPEALCACSFCAEFRGRTSQQVCTGVSPSGTGLSASLKSPPAGRAFTLPGFHP